MDHTMNLAGTDSTQLTPTTSLRRHYLLLVRKLKKPTVHANTQNPLDNKDPNPFLPSVSGEVAPKKSGFKLNPPIIGILVFIALSSFLFNYIATHLHERALHNVQINRLRNIGLALRVFGDNQGTNPNSIRRSVTSVANDLEVLIDPVSEKPFVIVGNFAPDEAIEPQKVLAYTPWIEGKGGACVMGDGSVQSFTPERFKAAIQSFPPAKSGGLDNR